MTQELKRIKIKKSATFRVFGLPVSWLRKVEPKRGDELVVEQDGEKLVISLRKQDDK